MLPDARGLALSVLLQRSDLRAVSLKVAMPQALGCAILPLAFFTSFAALGCLFLKIGKIPEQ